MPKFDAQKHHRHSIRLKGYDYTQPGAYFITLVTWQREYLFGEVISCEMRLNPFGQLVENEWRRLKDRFPWVSLDEWMIMPNHLHGIIMIVEAVGARQRSSCKTGDSSLASPIDSSDIDAGARQMSSCKTGDSSLASPIDSSDIDVGARQRSSIKTGESSLASPLQAISQISPSSQEENFLFGGPGVVSGSLGAIIGAYKSTTTRLINGLKRTPGSPVWQRNYYEHIIRNDKELEAIRAYIRNNPFRWEMDPDNLTKIQCK